MPMTAQEILQDEVKQHPNGYDLFFAYDDKIESGTIAEAFQGYRDMVAEAKEKGTEPDYTTFETYLEDFIYDKWELYDSIEDQIKYDFENNRDGDEVVIVNEYLEQEGISLGEALDNEGFAGVSWSLKDILSEYRMNLMFATENEKNYDMGSIPDMLPAPYLDEYKGDNHTITTLDNTLQNMTSEYQDKHFDNALSYLIHQQGYKVSQVAEVLYTGEPTTNEFLQSVVDEIDNFPDYSMASLTALVKLDADGLEALDQIAKGEGTVSLSKDTMIGIYNEWQGTGSLLEIELAKPFVVPADMVRNVQIEGQAKEPSNYTVDDVYGLIGSAWDGNIETFDGDSDREAIHKSIKDDIETTLEVVKTKALEVARDIDR